MDLTRVAGPGSRPVGCGDDRNGKGSGSGVLADLVDLVDLVEVGREVEFQEGGLAASTVPSQERFVFVKIGGKEVVLMKGRIHRYEGAQCGSVAGGGGVDGTAGDGAARGCVRVPAGSAAGVMVRLLEEVIAS